MPFVRWKIKAANLAELYHSPRGDEDEDDDTDDNSTDEEEDNPSGGIRTFTSATTTRKPLQPPKTYVPKALPGRRQGGPPAARETFGAPEFCLPSSRRGGNVSDSDVLLFSGVRRGLEAGSSASGVICVVELL